MPRIELDDLTEEEYPYMNDINVIDEYEDYEEAIDASDQMENSA